MTVSARIRDRAWLSTARGRTHSNSPFLPPGIGRCTAMVTGMPRSVPQSLSRTITSWVTSTSRLVR